MTNSGFLPVRKRAQSDTFDFYKYILLAFIVCVCSSAGRAALSTAPVNPEFTAWQAAPPSGVGVIPSPIDRSYISGGSGGSFPSSYDLRTLGCVTSVKNQGSCGSSWNFATYGSLESWLEKSFFETWDFSENNLKNYHSFDPAPCNGGNADMSTAYLARWAGPVNEANDPYHDWDDRPSPGGAYKKCLEKVLWFFTDNDIKSAVMTYGGLYVTMYYDSAHYNSSDYTYYYDGSEVANHAVTLVGWDDNKVVAGAPANGAWLVKNSLGTGWGDSGYFWVSYSDTKAVLYAAAFCKAVSASAYSTIYQYDPLGWTASAGYGTAKAYAANIFVPASNGKLKAIGVYAVDKAMTGRITIYDTFNSSTGKFSDIKGSISGTFPNSGYYTINLASPLDLTAGNNFAIVVEFTTSSGYTYPIPIEKDFAGYSSGAAASSGQSYVSSDGSTFQDITSISGFAKTNVCIRALMESPTAKTLTTSSSVGGSTIPQTGSYLYGNGDVVGIYAIPGAHYHFVNWTGSAVTAGKVANPSSPSTTVLMDNSYTVQANFALDQNSLTISAGTGGTITTPGPGTFVYSYGTNVSIAASADEHYYFHNWTGTAVTAGKVADPNSSSTTVLVDANYTVEANFRLIQQTLITSATSGGGVVTVPGMGAYEYDYGAEVNVVASANSGFHFVNWAGTAVTAGKVTDPNSPATTVIMEGDYGLRAYFTKKPAFPGAEGPGRFATGGRGGNVYEVTNLTNDANVGSGSIVDALSEPNRTVVFRVSGTIELNGTKLYPKSNTTIAGQTAPGDGICIKGRIHIKDDVHDIIIRYIRVRVDEGAANSSGDAIDIDACSNVIIDHVTASYSRDEGISCQELSSNITVQWCIISESLTYENHSYGSLVRGQNGQEKTYHHNLYAHNNNRNPRPGNYIYYTSDSNGLYFDFRNNVIYNWKGNYAGYNEDFDNPAEESYKLAVSRYNFIGNAYIRGPESTTSSGLKGFREKSRVSYGYFADNSYDGAVLADQWDIVLFANMTTAEINAYKANSYLIPLEPVTTTSPEQARADVLKSAGASFPKRDIIDRRIISDVIYKTGHSIRTTADQPEGGWPVLDSLPAPADNDHDGMPNIWETANGLDPNDAADRNYYDLDGDYTNLEVYLNSLLAVAAAPYTQWTQRYDGSAGGSDYATDMAVDSAGNAYVTGYAKIAGKNYGFATVKYDPAGNVVWTKTYNRQTTSYDYAMAITLDASSNVIVAGYDYTEASGYDGTVVKYDSAGNKLWVKLYNSSGTTDDRFYDVVTDSSGNIYLAGRINGDGLLMKYTSSGNLSWMKTYNGSGGGFDALYKVAIAGDSNLYACGESEGTDTGQDCLIVKCSTGGSSLWKQTHNGETDGEDWLEAIALDAAENVYVTGSADSNYITMKYTPDGNSLWTSSYGGTASGWDEAYAITLDSGGNVVVTGYSDGSASGTDAATIKYNSQTGEQMWSARYNGAGNSTDYAEAITADSSGNVYIHGRSFENMNSLDYLTICYNSDGTEKWKRNYDGPALKTDMGSAIALYGTNSVYVTGSSMNASGHYDYATIKYILSNCPAPPSGDLNGDCQVDFMDITVLADDYTGSRQNKLTLGDIAEGWLNCDMVIQNYCWQ